MDLCIAGKAMAIKMKKKIIIICITVAVVAGTSGIGFAISNSKNDKKIESAVNEAVSLALTTSEESSQPASIEVSAEESTSNETTAKSTTEKPVKETPKQKTTTEKQTTTDEPQTAIIEDRNSSKTVVTKKSDVDMTTQSKTEKPNTNTNTSIEQKTTSVSGRYKHEDQYGVYEDYCPDDCSWADGIGNYGFCCEIAHYDREKGKWFFHQIDGSRGYTSH